MTGARAQAYGQVVKVLAEKGPSRLQPHEQDLLREAADALLFSAERDEQAEEAAGDARALARHLVEAGRWDVAEADALVAAVDGCGPPELVAA